MELEEAIKKLKLRTKELKLNYALTNPDLEAIETVLQELDRLQKENTMLENTKNNCPHFNTSGISCDKKFCNLDDYISKNEIKDCLEDIENYFENVSVPYEDIEFIKEKRKDLLKEE